MPCIFTGRTCVYFGSADSWDDEAGHVLLCDLPMPVCDKTAGGLESLDRDDLLITPSTWLYNGGGCCQEPDRRREVASSSCSLVVNELRHYRGRRFVSATPTPVRVIRGTTRTGCQPPATSGRI